MNSEYKRKLISGAILDIILFIFFMYMEWHTIIKIQLVLIIIGIWVHYYHQDFFNDYYNNKRK